VRNQHPTRSNKRKHPGTNYKKPLTYNPAAEIVRVEHMPIVTGLSTATIWRLRNAGEFVPAIQLGKNAVGFRRSDIVAWLNRNTQDHAR